MVAAASTRSLPNVLAIAAELVGGQLRPASAPKVPTFQQIGEQWTSGDLAARYPNRIRTKRSGAREPDPVTAVALSPTYVARGLFRHYVLGTRIRATAISLNQRRVSVACLPMCSPSERYLTTIAVGCVPRRAGYAASRAHLHRSARAALVARPRARGREVAEPPK